MWYQDIVLTLRTYTATLFNIIETIHRILSLISGICSLKYPNGVS